MFRNWLSSAWGDLRRSPVQSFIAIGGLALGLMAAILAGIITANQYSYDHFIPGFGQTYYAEIEFRNPGTGASGPVISVNQGTPLDLAKYLHQAIPEIAITRLQGDSRHLRHGVVEDKEEFYWADPNVFQILPLPVLYGRLDKALSRPDGIVIPRSIAEKYFGRDNVVGETLQLNRQQVLTVTAVIADFPVNATTLYTGIFASGRAVFSTMAIESAKTTMGHDGSMSTHNTVTLVRIASDLSLSNLEQRASVMADSFVPKSETHRRGLRFVPMDRMRLSSAAQTKILLFDAVGLLILFLACVNFVNLSTARAARRGVEVGIRKAAGAARGALILQFLGESVLQALVALAIAVTLVEWLLPVMNTFLEAGAVFDYWRDPVLAGALLAGTLLVGVLAGVYPALVLSSFHPAAVLKGLATGSGKAVVVRQVLVTTQFAILVALLIAAGTVFLQDRFATKDALRLDTHQMLVIKTTKCEDAFQTQLAALPGVRGVACSASTLQPDHNNLGSTAAVRGGGYLGLSLVSVGYGLLELYGLKPLAGRFFDAGHGDAIPDPAATDFTVRYVLNETAVRKLGFSSPQAALGQMVKFVPYWMQMGLPPPKNPDGKPISSTLNGVVIGVVRDFAMTSGDKQIDPAAYSVGVPMSGIVTPATFPDKLINVKLSGRDIPETLAAIDALWRKAGSVDPITGSVTPIDRVFVDAYIARLEQDVVREAQIYATFAGIAMFLGCLGLFGLSLSTTARRIKEIGVRKAAGARNREIVALLLWQFTQPVLWANLIAWPLAFWIMGRWLNGFAYHIAMPLWLFPAVGAITLAVALLTVAGQTLLVARQRPVLALRYE